MGEHGTDRRGASTGESPPWRGRAARRHSGTRRAPHGWMKRHEVRAGYTVTIAMQGGLNA